MDAAGGRLDCEYQVAISCQLYKYLLNIDLLRKIGLKSTFNIKHEIFSILFAFDFWIVVHQVFHFSLTSEKRRSRGIIGTT